MIRIIYLFKVAAIAVATLLTCVACSNKLDEDLAQNLCNTYSAEELSYFAEIAFGAERGKGANDKNLRWYKDVKIRVFGGYHSKSDSVTLMEVIDTLNSIIDPIEVTITDGTDYNIILDFMSIYDLDSITVNHKTPYKLQGAQFHFEWHMGQIDRARIIILNETHPELRTRYIWEEVVQVMGLMQDRPTYPKSIFHDCSNADCKDVKKPLPIDLKLLDILYNSGIPTFMTRDEFLEKINKCKD
ncbi:MAG: DUF2927 domain-containing protein [Cyclobacteriaceae bacterium]